MALLIFCVLLYFIVDMLFGSLKELILFLILIAIIVSIYGAVLR